MIKRDILDYLRAWSMRRKRKPLVIRGARQVGKTTVVKELSKEFDAFIMLNMEFKADKDIFEVADTPDKVLDILLLSRLPGVSRKDGKRILLFIDEIQSQPKAIGMLRYFYEDCPDIHVVAAGSRLQELFKTGVSFPVGRVEYVNMRPCFFDEFLDGMGMAALREMIIDARVDESQHEETMRLFQAYALVGGMPEIVSEYCQDRQLTQLSPLYRGLLQSYDEDIEKYASTRQQVAVIRHILRNGWGHAGQTISFARFAGSSYASTAVHEAFELLEKAFLVNLDYPTISVKAPVEESLSRSPKLIWVDAGLVNFSANIQVEYLQNASLAHVWRGHAAEQIVGQELWKPLDRNFIDKELFWVRDKKGSDAEVDFVFQTDGKVIPIEVKSGSNAHLRSLQSFISQPGAPDTAVRIWPGRFSVDEVKNTLTGSTFRLINLPFYYTSAIDSIIRKFS